MRPPRRVVAFAEAIDARITTSRPPWRVARTFMGVWPIPSVDTHFGKRSSCVVGARLPVSCAEVEVVGRLVEAGWVGGWLSAYNPSDPRFPEDWRSALISSATARQIISSEFPSVAVTMSGIPDLIFQKDGVVVVAECKRLRGRYRRNDCTWTSWGDRANRNQRSWVENASAAVMPLDAIVELWWTREDAAACD